jgi:subtilisin family serine protease
MQTMQRIFLVITLAFGLGAGKGLTQNNYEIVRYYEAMKLLNSNPYINDDTIVIAIIDKGVNLTHEDLIQNIWINKHEVPHNNIDDDNNGYIDDIHGWNFENNSNDVTNNGIGNWHGTPINGIIGAISGNKLGIDGICPSVKLLNIVKGDDIESITLALKYIHTLRKRFNETRGKEGEFIVAINCSWGKDSLWADDYPIWCSIYDSLGNEGILCVNSVPNNHVDVDIIGDMPTTCESRYLITVTNSNQNDVKIYDAGYGSISVDLAVPGDNTFTTLNNSGYGYFGGTSASAPYVTATIGLMYLLPIEQINRDRFDDPAKLAERIKEAIILGVDKNPDLNDLIVSGGRLNMFSSLKLLCDTYEHQRLHLNIFDHLKIISIYPNPAISESYITIESDSDVDVKISIYSMMGEAIRSYKKRSMKGINSIHIDLSGISGGNYIVTLFTKYNMISQKLMIID